jgi:hypothetical protein
VRKFFITGLFALMPGFQSQAWAMKLWPFGKKVCEAAVESPTRFKPSKDHELAEAILGLLDANNPYRESQTRLLRTSREMQQFEAELNRLSVEFARLMPQLSQNLRLFSQSPSPDSKADLEVALLEIEILVDQIKNLCKQIERGVSIRIHELRSGIVARPDVMRQIPPEILQELQNPKDINHAMKLVGEATQLSQLEVSVMEEFRMILFFIELQRQISKSMKEGYTPVLNETVRQAHLALGRQHKESGH